LSTLSLNIALTNILRKISDELEFKWDNKFVKEIIRTSKRIEIHKRLVFLLNKLDVEAFWVSIDKSSISNLPEPYIINTYSVENLKYSFGIVNSENDAELNVLNPFDLKTSTVKISTINNQTLKVLLLENYKSQIKSKKEETYITASDLKYFFLFVIASAICLLLYTSIYLQNIAAIANLLLSTSIITLIASTYFHETSDQSNVLTNSCGKKTQNCERIWNINPLRYKFLNFRILANTFSLTTLLSSILFILSGDHSFLTIVIAIGCIGLIVVVYALYYQYVVVQSTCHICLFIASLFTLWLIIQLSQFTVIYPTTTVTLSSIAAAIFSHMLAMIIHKNTEVSKENIASKNTINTIKCDLQLDNLPTSPSYLSSFRGVHFPKSLGNKQSTKALDLIIGLNCRHCYNYTRQITQLVRDHQDVTINIWIAQQGKLDARQMYYALKLSKAKGTNEILSILDKCFSRERIEKETITEPIEREFIVNVPYVPILMYNNKVVPGFLKISDIRFSLSQI